MVKIKWLIEARDDLDAIYEYIHRDSPRYAQRQVAQIRDRVNVLHDQIRSGKVVAELMSEVVRELIEGNYRIIYRIVSETEVHILMVHHGARDFYRRLD